MGECIERKDALWLVYSGKIITGDNSDKSARELIESIPAADSQPVVTCGRCKYFVTSYGKEYCASGRCKLSHIEHEREFYCAYGEVDVRGR